MNLAIKKLLDLVAIATGSIIKDQLNIKDYYVLQNHTRLF